MECICPKEQELGKELIQCPAIPIAGRKAIVTLRLSILIAVATAFVACEKVVIVADVEPSGVKPEGVINNGSGGLGVAPFIGETGELLDPNGMQNTDAEDPPGDRRLVVFDDRGGAASIDGTWVDGSTTFNIQSEFIQYGDPVNLDVGESVELIRSVESTGVVETALGIDVPTVQWPPTLAVRSASGRSSSKPSSTTITVTNNDERRRGALVTTYVRKITLTETRPFRSGSGTNAARTASEVYYSNNFYIRKELKGR